MNALTGTMRIVGLLPSGEIRGAIQSLENFIVTQGLNEGAGMCPLRHTFVDGVYAREITMFEGQTVVGRIHKHAHLNFITKGKVRVLTEQEGAVEYAAPCMFVSQPGTKRLVHILEDCIWTTVHKTNCTNPDEAVRELTVPSYDDIELNAEFEVIL